jgi:hypothetical protein
VTHIGIALTLIQGNIMKPSIRHLALAAAVSGLFAGALLNTGCNSDSRSGNATASDNASDKHACKGMNACKGKGGCKTDKNACKGMNACKGKGGCKTN